ncbi:uncharacterized protein [Rutidosis leptorrhynchoides]|uniref:uncharacterized protein isoform X1 n=1 Tax=Rutidosis leptorrhynchoides TaxID=125765 RepID=UPI003A9A5130
MASFLLQLPNTTFRNLTVSASSSSNGSVPSSSNEASHVSGGTGKGGPVILELPLNQIRRPLMRTRSNDPHKVQQLMDSIAQIGLQVPDSNFNDFRCQILWLPCCERKTRSLFFQQSFFDDKKERRERTGSWRLHNCLLSYQAILVSSSSSNMILYLTYYKNNSLSKLKTIDYLPKRIETPTYEKRSQIS